MTSRFLKIPDNDESSKAFYKVDKEKLEKNPNDSQGH